MRERKKYEKDVREIGRTRQWRERLTGNPYKPSMFHRDSDKILDRSCCWLKLQRSREEELRGCWLKLQKSGEEELRNKKIKRKDYFSNCIYISDKILLPMVSLLNLFGFMVTLYIFPNLFSNDSNKPGVLTSITTSYIVNLDAIF